MAEEIVTVQVPFVQTVDDKVYFPGAVEVPMSVAKKLTGLQQAKEDAVAATGNPEAAPLTKEAEGPDVTVGSPSGKKKGGSGSRASDEEGEE